MIQFLIVGWQRMGTSMLARVLHESGLNMGPPFLPADHVNPRGYYENRAFLHLCKSEMSYPELDPRIFLDPRKKWPIVSSAVSHFLGARCADGTDGLKCPLSVPTWPMWAASFSDVVMLVLRRDKAANLASLHSLSLLRQRQGRSVAKSDSEIELYHELCLARVNLIAATHLGVEVNYEDMLTKEGQAKIEATLGAVLPFESLNWSVIASEEEVEAERHAGRWL